MQHCPYSNFMETQIEIVSFEIEDWCNFQQKMLLIDSMKLCNLVIRFKQSTWQSFTYAIWFKRAFGFTGRIVVKMV